MADVQLVIVDGPDQGREFDLAGAVVIGRDASAGIVIEDAEASRRHASINAVGVEVTVEDLGSTNGTFVNGARIAASQTLGDGDRVRIGSTVLQVRSLIQATKLGTAIPEPADPQATAIGHDVPGGATQGEPAPTAGGEAPGLPATDAPPPHAQPPGPPTPPPSFEPPAAGPPGGQAPPPAAPPGGPPPGAPPPGPLVGGPPPGGGFAPQPAPPAGQPPYGGGLPPVAYQGGGPPGATYPVRVDFDYPVNGIARWRPLLHWLLAIPHFIALFFVGIAAFVGFIVAWFAIVFTRRYPPGIFNFIAGTMRWSTRAVAYYLWLIEPYPPFSLADDPRYPVRVQFDYPQNGIARWRPFLQWLMAIPQQIVLYFVLIAAYVVVFISWFAVIITGRYPAGMWNFVAGALRWSTRVNAYVYLMTEEYPPFSLE